MSRRANVECGDRTTKTACWLFNVFLQRFCVTILVFLQLFQMPDLLQLIGCCVIGVESFATEHKKECFTNMKEQKRMFHTHERSQVVIHGESRNRNTLHAETILRGFFPHFAFWTAIHVFGVGTESEN